MFFSFLVPVAVLWSVMHPSPTTIMSSRQSPASRPSHASSSAARPSPSFRDVVRAQTRAVVPYVPRRSILKLRTDFLRRRSPPKVKKEREDKEREVASPLTALGGPANPPTLSGARSPLCITPPPTSPLRHSTTPARPSTKFHRLGVHLTILFEMVEGTPMVRDVAMAKPKIVDLSE